MAKPINGKSSPKTIPVEKQILMRMKDKGTQQTWLAKKVHTSNANLHYILKGKGKNKRSLSTDMLAKINAALETSFTQEEHTNA